MSNPHETSLVHHLSMQRIASAKVMVVGCGALGNEALKNLVLSGVRRLVVVDYDLVEERNLCHSILFRHSDIGQPKALVAAKALQTIAPDIQCRVIIGDVEHDVGLGVICDCDVVVGCVDNRWARYCINRLCMRAGKPWVDGGIAWLDGTARVFAPGINCYACNLGEEGEKEMRRHISCADVAQSSVSAAHAPTTVIAASVIAAVQTQEALKIISDGITPNSLAGSMFCYDGDTPRANVVKFQAYDDDCPVHERWTPIEPAEIDIDCTLAQALEYMEGIFCTTARDTYACGSERGEDGDFSSGMPGCRDAGQEGRGVEIYTTDFSFVDYAEHRLTGETVELMCPSYAVERILANIFGNVDIKEYLCRGYSLLNADFPYQELSLRQIGFADEAVLRVNETRFFRLSAT